MAKTMQKIDQNGIPKKYSKIISKMVPKPSIFEPDARGEHPKISKSGPKKSFLGDANFDQKNEPKNLKKQAPATTTYGRVQMDLVPPLPQTPSPRA